jgi:hypothetical protein
VAVTWPVGWRAIIFGAVGGLAALLAVGLPTAVVPNALFDRMTPTRPHDYLILGLTALLAAALSATYALPANCPLQEGKLMTGGLLSFLAVGCPVCNKVVVLLLGASGALAYFEPVQPLLAAGGLGLLGVALALRLRAVRAQNETVKTSPPEHLEEPAHPIGPATETLDEPRPMRPKETPEAFYRRITQRPDIREILRRLAR